MVDSSAQTCSAMLEIWDDTGFPNERQDETPLPSVNLLLV